MHCRTQFDRKSSLYSFLDVFSAYLPLLVYQEDTKLYQLYRPKKICLFHINPKKVGQEPPITLCPDQISIQNACFSVQNHKRTFRTNRSIRKLMQTALQERGEKNTTFHFPWSLPFVPTPQIKLHVTTATHGPNLNPKKQPKFQSEINQNPTHPVHSSARLLSHQILSQLPTHAEGKKEKEETGGRKDGRPTVPPQKRGEPPETEAAGETLEMLRERFFLLPPGRWEEARSWVRACTAAAAVASWVVGALALGWEWERRAVLFLILLVLAGCFWTVVNKYY